MLRKMNSTKNSASNIQAIQTIYFSISTNLALSFIKWLIGHYGHSFAVIADAIESSTDVLSSILVLIGLRYITKPPDHNHPYGHGRLEPLLSFVVVVFLVISSLVIAHEAIVHIQKPHELPKAFTLIFLGPLIIWKEFSYRYILKKSIATKSSSLKADAWHHRSDAITTLAAFIGISIALCFGKGFESADDWAALVASVFILYNSYLIFRIALGEILDEHLYDELIEDIRNLSKNVHGIIDTEKCYIRKAGMSFHVDLHAIVDRNLSVVEGHDLAHKLKNYLQSEIPDLSHVLIHIEPDE